MIKTFTQNQIHNIVRLNTILQKNIIQDFDNNQKQYFLINPSPTKLDKDMVLYGWTDVDIDLEQTTETTLLSQSIRGIQFSFNRLINNDPKFTNKSISLISSDLNQSFQTATVCLADVSDRNIQGIEVDPNIREVHQGDWEGKRLLDLTEDELNNINDSNFRFPGGETFSESNFRFKRKLMECKSDVNIVFGHKGVNYSIFKGQIEYDQGMDNLGVYVAKRSKESDDIQFISSWKMNFTE